MAFPVQHQVSYIVGILFFFFSSIFATTLTQFGIGNGQGDLLLILNLIEEAGKARGNLSFNEGSNFLESSCSAVELLKALQLEPISFVRPFRDQKNFRR